MFSLFNFSSVFSWGDQLTPFSRYVRPPMLTPVRMMCTLQGWPAEGERPDSGHQRPRAERRRQSPPRRAGRSGSTSRPDFMNFSVPFKFTNFTEF